MTLTIYLLVVTSFVHIGRVVADSEWNVFKSTYNKTYSREEEQYRLLVWKQNRDKIREHNLEADAGKHTFRLGMNHFGDMTTDEINNYFNGLRVMVNESDVRDARLTSGRKSDVTVPKEIDWRILGYVTPVKFQRHCGSCYAFSATGALEGQHFRKTGRLVSLSEQNLIDCTIKYGNHGCRGGYMDNAFRYIIKNQGVDTEKAYPYHADVQKCQFRPNGRGATCSGLQDIPKGDEAALQKAVGTVGPVSVGIDAKSFWFHFYMGGVYTNSFCSSVHLNHGVLVVGYGREGNKDYWIVKNSWGSWWGDKGYIKMARNNHNQCGIASLASYPIV